MSGGMIALIAILVAAVAVAVMGIILAIAIPYYRGVAKSSDRIGDVLDGCREAPEQRSDGSASLVVKGRSRHPRRNESDKTFGNPHSWRATTKHENPCATPPGASPRVK
jgi:Tfp pilus assembly major pilin PilA